MKEPITKEDLREHLKTFGEVLDAKIDTKMNASNKIVKAEMNNLRVEMNNLRVEVDKSFTEKVVQIEEKFFKYSRQTTGIILGGVSVLLALYGILQYTFSNTNPRSPINIYTYSQDKQMDLRTPKIAPLDKANITNPQVLPEHPKHQDNTKSH